MKDLLRPLLWPFIYLGMKIIFPKFKNKDYYTLRVMLLGIRQKLTGVNKKVKWPVHFTSVVIEPQNITIGNKPVGFAIGCFIDGRNGIKIGDNVWVGPRVSLISQNHNENDYYKYVSEKPIIIGKDSLLTANCVVLPGVELGEHTIVAAGAVVTKSFPEGNQLLAGIPAKVIRKLEPYTG